MTQNFESLRFSTKDRVWQVDHSRVHDVSIPLLFDGAQPNFFGAPIASSTPLVAGDFIGDVRKGGSCNCATYSITPHCNGTHTECVGHVTGERLGIRNVQVPALILARLVTLSPVDALTSGESTQPLPHAGDHMITRAALEHALRSDTLEGCAALVVRTTPNSVSKRTRSYGPDEPPPYFSAEFMHAIVASSVEHLVCDLPSVDRAADEGKLTAHRIFWGLPAGAIESRAASRPQATITELAYIDDAIEDGLYVLNLQVPPFDSDAAPSRPLLLPLVPV
jgi:kynurenine formamidase